MNGFVTNPGVLPQAGANAAEAGQTPSAQGGATAASPFAQAAQGTAQQTAAKAGGMSKLVQGFMVATAAVAITAGLAALTVGTGGSGIALLAIFAGTLAVCMQNPSQPPALPPSAPSYYPPPGLPGSQRASLANTAVQTADDNKDDVEDKEEPDSPPVVERPDVNDELAEAKNDEDAPVNPLASEPRLSGNAASPAEQRGEPQPEADTTPDDVIEGETARNLAGSGESEAQRFMVNALNDIQSVLANSNQTENPRD